MSRVRQIIAYTTVILNVLGCAVQAGDKHAAMNGQINPNPPPPKQVVAWALSANDIPLSIDSSCAGIGTEQSDATVGDYLSGFLAEFAESGSGNSLEASCEEGDSQESVEAVWMCKFVVRRQDGEDEWGWGVSFEVGKHDNELRRESLRCIGSG